VSINKIGKNLSTGGSIGLLVFMAWGSLILLGLFLSVHSRGIQKTQNELQERWPNVILLWEKEGYINQGGLWFSKPPNEDSSQAAISPYGMGFLQTTHLLERIQIWLNGSFSYKLLAFHNQLIPMLSSALLGFLAMRLTLSLKIRPVHAFVLGLGAQSMYQTFPGNLWFIWEVYPPTLGVLFMALFLTCEVSNDCYEPKSNVLQLLRKLSVFCMVYVEWVGALCFFSVYCFMCSYFSPRKRSMRVELGRISLPLLLAFVMVFGQLIWAKISYPEIDLIGNSAGVQIGLNKSFLQVKELAMPLKKRYDPLLPSWNILMIAGLLSTFVVMTLVQKKKKNYNYLIFLATGIGFYALFLLLNPESFILPEAYQGYLAFTLILALFALLPGWLETFNKNSGIFVLLSFVIAFCWSCIQLRNYSIYYPL
jgi:hypothetical protein